MTSVMRKPPRTADGAAKGGHTSRVSIRDVATAAKVSIATVSRVINDTGAVSPETAARVREVIKRIKFVPNPFAQGLITQASRVLGLVLPDIHGEFFSEILRGADAEAHALGYSLLVSTQLREGDPIGLAAGYVDGLAVMIAESNHRLPKKAADSAVPLVVLDTDLHSKGFDSVVIDNAPGTHQAVEHLLTGVSPEDVYFVGGPRKNFDTEQRAAAFTEALRHAGKTPRAEQVSYGRYTVDWGREWLAAALNGHRAKRLGVLAGNDEIAIGILQGAQESGVAIPGDLRLVGFDDTRLASLIRPCLTTVRVPMAEVGAAAVRLLVRRIHEPNAASTCVHLTTALVIRDSSAPKR